MTEDITTEYEESVEVAELRGQLVLAIAEGQIDTTEPPLAELPLRLAARVRNE